MKEDVIKYGLVLVVLYLLINKVGSLFKGEQKSGATKNNLINPYAPTNPLYLKGEYAKKKASKSKKWTIPLFTQKEAERRAKLVYSAKGIVKDVDDKALSALNCEYKSQVAQISEKFEKIYSRSMMDYLNSFLDTENMNILNQRIEKLK